MRVHEGRVGARRIVSASMLGVACLLVIAFWIRSYIVADVLVPPGEAARQHLIESDRGLIRLRWMRVAKPYVDRFGDHPKWQWWTDRPQATWYGLHGSAGAKYSYVLGFGYIASDYDPQQIYGGGWPYVVVVFPYWFLGLLTIVAVALNVRSFARRYLEIGRETSGRCVQCGYDLRGHSGICPECGQKVASRQGSSVEDS